MAINHYSDMNINKQATHCQRKTWDDDDDDDV